MTISAGLERVGSVPVGSRPLPPLVDAIRLRPESLVGQRISIPMFTDSEDPEFVRELAAAVMCGSNPGCQVKFIGSPVDIAMLMDQLADPAHSSNWTLSSRTVMLFNSYSGFTGYSSSARAGPNAIWPIAAISQAIPDRVAKKQAEMHTAPSPGTIEAQPSASTSSSVQHIIDSANDLFEQRGIAIRFQVHSNFKGWTALLVDIDSGAIIGKYSPSHIMRVVPLLSVDIKGLLLSHFV